MRGWGWAPTSLLLLLLLAAMLLSSDVAVGDPANLVLNGDFEIEFFNWGLFPQMDVLVDGTMNMVPFFSVVSGGVQIVNGLEYIAPAWEPGNFMMHLNCWLGPGVIKTTPLATPRWGATYNLTFDIADNPDGGPLTKSVAVRILVNDQKSGDPIPWFNVSNPEAQRSSIIWEKVSFVFVGTGESTTIVFESLTPGSFGCLIDNINVRLVNLLDNGSFDRLQPPGLVRSDITFYNVVKAPSSIITNWAVTAGAIKWSGNERWQSSTDESFYLLDMNADGLSGTIVSGKVTLLVGQTYTILYDSAANPDSTLPVKGVLLLDVSGVESGDSVASKSINIDGTGFSQFSIGWRTEKLEFVARETQVYLTFSSKIQGDLGPLLDNVNIYRQAKVGCSHSAVYQTPRKACAFWSE
ncbi:hypothetical protein AXG93_2175s1110 [Marchantia polymorpha subsp. ruderalis]|uniref:DUF642 domain-containing protein n=1 Tax=Marchantia polymorpha subsp. ruderalis TaxID=1480154 RepID=A0A176W622_MARPO|nr:hypothetical protein AXG93_2175s1110 [Marchantia polymorpha subsp. ruderalis]